MTRRTLLVPLFAAAFILAPSKLSGQVTPVTGPFEVSPQSRLLATWVSNTEATTPGGASYEPVMGGLWEVSTDR